MLNHLLGFEANIGSQIVLGKSVNDGCRKLWSSLVLSRVWYTGLTPGSVVGPGGGSFGAHHRHRGDHKWVGPITGFKTGTLLTFSSSHEIHSLT